MSAKSYHEEKTAPHKVRFGLKFKVCSPSLGYLPQSTRPISCFQFSKFNPICKYYVNQIFYCFPMYHIVSRSELYEIYLTEISNIPTYSYHFLKCIRYLYLAISLSRWHIYTTTLFVLYYCRYSTTIYSPGPLHHIDIYPFQFLDNRLA